MDQTKYKEAIKAKDIDTLKLEAKICEMEIEILKQKMKYDDFWRMSWYKRLFYALIGET